MEDNKKKKTHSCLVKAHAVQSVPAPGTLQCMGDQQQQQFMGASAAPCSE
jgi:hypothetical protein